MVVGTSKFQLNLGVICIKGSVLLYSEKVVTRPVLKSTLLDWEIEIIKIPS